MSPMRLTGLFLIAVGSHLLAGTSFPLHARLALDLQEVTGSQAIDSLSGSGPVAQFPFDGTISNTTDTPVRGMAGGEVSFVKGLVGQALSLSSEDPLAFLTLDRANLPFGTSHDFSVQFWIRTVVEGQPFVVLSQKEYVDNSLASQKQSGWVFYVSGGTWAWNMGSGTRRIAYERDNGKHMPLNDGRWHQLTMTHSSARSEIRLFYDGEDKVWYNVRDSD